MRAIFRNLVVALFGAILSLGFYGQEAEAVLKGSGAASSVSAAAYPLLAPDGTQALPSYAFATTPATGFWTSGSTTNVRLSINNSDAFYFGAGFMQVGSGGQIAWGSAAGASSANDLALSRDAAGTLAIKQSTAADAAVRKYATNGGYTEWGSATELLTLSTGGTTTDTAANLLPANSVIESVTARVTTTITTATDWKLGDATIAGRFTAANATLIAGTTAVGLVHIDLTGTSGPRQTAAAKVRVTTTGTPGAGAIRITVYYRTFVPATS